MKRTRIFVAVFLLFCLLLCACAPKMAGQGKDLQLPGQAASDAPTISASGTSAKPAQQPTEGAAEITVYKTATKALSLPEEAARVCGLAADETQLFVFYESGAQFFAARYTADGEFLSTAPLAVTESRIADAAGAQNGTIAVRLRGEADAPEDAVSSLAVFDSGLTLLRCNLLPDECQGAMGPVMTEDGSCIFWKLQSLYLVSAEGELLQSMTLSGAEMVSVTSAVGGAFATVMEGGVLGVCPIDWENGALGSFTPLGKSPACYTLLSGSGQMALVQTKQGLYRYDCDAKTYTALLDWQQEGMSGTDIRYLSALDQTHIAWSDASGVSLTVAEPTTVRREIVAVAAVGTYSARLEALAASFNSSSDTYHAVVEYYPDASGLITQMIAGAAPDALDVTAAPIVLGERNFVDLMPYLEADPELSQEDLVQSVLSAMKVDGKLLAMPSSFFLQTVTGREAQVGAYRNWTAADLQALLQEAGGDVAAFPAWMTARELMLWVANVSLGQFVNWDEKTCRFDSEAFCALLEFCRQMPEEFRPDDSVSDYAQDVLLTVQMFQNVGRLRTLKQNYGAGGISYVGFPGDGSNNGSLFSCADTDVLLTIPAAGKNPDAAWALIRHALGRQWQESAAGLPIRMDVLRAQLDALKEDANGNVTEEDIVQFLKTVSETALFIYNDQTISGIVLEEAMPFFEGDCTSADAAKKVQNRVSLYLMENQ